MNPNLCRVVLRPRGPFEVLDLAVRLSRANWRSLAWMMLVLCGPLAVVSTGLCWWLDGHWGLLAIPILAAPVIQAPFTILTGRLLFSDEVSVRDALGTTVRRAGALLGAWLAVALGIGVSSFTCFYGAPVVQIGLVYVTECALLERVSLQRGLTRSVRLATAALPQSGGGVMLRWGLLIWAGLVAEAFGQAIVGFVLQLGEPFGSLQAGQVTPYLLAGLLVSQAIWSVYRLLLYVDARTRLEGWDLQVGLRAVGLAS